MSSANREFFRLLVSEQLRVVRAGALYAIGYVVLLTLGYAYIDFYHSGDDALYALGSLLGWAVGYVLLLGLMQSAGLISKGTVSGVLIYFLLGITTGLPIILGFFLLIVPGVYLMLRWLPVFAVAIAREPRPIRAMSESWHATSPHIWPLAISLLGPFLMVAVATITLVAVPLSGTETFALFLLSNLALSLGTAWFTLLGVASFSLMFNDVRWAA
jgi:hypothetical protein